MKKHRGRGHFWHKWNEMRHTFDEGETDFNHRMAWKSHFSDFLGVSPEDHWLFSGRRFKPWSKGGWGPPGLFNPFIAMLMSKGGGLLSIFVLHLLSEKSRYGNEIMNEIEQRTQGHWGANPGAIYPLLSIMEEDGLVKGDWEDQNKRRRRIYRLTKEGGEELQRLKDVMRPKLEEAIEVLNALHEEFEEPKEG